MLDRLRHFFRSKKSGLQDFSAVGVDVHSHLIPGIDDGSPDMESSIALIREMHALGYHKIITTPHIMSGVYNNTSEGILRGLEEVRAAVKEAAIPVQLDAAAEYYLDEQFEQWVNDQIPLLTFGNRLLLFETGFSFEPGNLRSIIFKLNSEGYKPVLAHPERYQYLHDKNLNKYHSLKDMGLYFQLNISSLTGVYSKRVKEIARKLIDHELVDFIGTDLHNKKHLEYLKSSLNEIYLGKLIDSGKLLNQNLL